jgi:hypothetical protein
MNFNNEYRKAFIEMASSHQWIDPFAVTLTMRWQSWRQHSQNFRHFMNRLNTQIHGNAYKRYGRRLSVLPVIEGTHRDHPHYHCVIDNPRSDNRVWFEANIFKCWNQTELGLPEMSITPEADIGWIRYMAKPRDKDNYNEAFDWENAWFEHPDRR